MNKANPFTVLVILVFGMACGRSDASSVPDGSEAPSAESASSTGATVGTIRASLGNEQRVWSVLARDGGQGPASSAIYRTRAGLGRRLVMLTLSGYTGDRPMVSGMITITVGTMAEPGSCPCEVTLQSVEVWDDESRMYRTSGTTVTLDVLKPAEGDSFRAEGSFSGTLEPDGTFEDADPPREIRGTFTIGRVVAGPGG